MHATVHKSSSGARTSLERLHAEMQDEHRLRRVQGPMSLTALGELLAWILGWDLIVEYAKACATVAASWSHDLDELLRITVGWHSVDPHNWTGISVTTRHMPADPTAKWGLIGQLGLNSWLTPVDDAVRSQLRRTVFRGSCSARQSSSLRLSDSIRFRRTRNKPSDRSGTCQSRFSCR